MLINTLNNIVHLPPGMAVGLLSGKLDWSNAKKIEDVTEIIEVSSTSSKNEKISFDKYMSPYIKALAVIAYKAMNSCDGNLSIVAQKLGITRQTLYNKIKRFGL